MTAGTLHIFPDITHAREPSVWTTRKSAIRLLFGPSDHFRRFREDFTLARDLGLALNTGAHLSALCRTRIGPYQLHDAYDIEALKNVLREQESPGL